MGDSPRNVGDKIAGDRINKGFEGNGDHENLTKGHKEPDCPVTDQKNGQPDDKPRKVKWILPKTEKRIPHNSSIRMWGFDN
jgi:hypothetical protein